ncbi:hypothetical protein PQ455_01390 [Sphingomonas naphthae]|uniref:Uncharacterized protein n=1 Tax=Sphingomonas naphthae TaxID=1813468 RepID=A0ABY7TND8_9SPHN|nr:hypothetical protein [Sphingomonas naphthae]WCT73915.1 hypothetical protein PQ455_01390 [Sphingomonas naphthae]
MIGRLAREALAAALAQLILAVGTALANKIIKPKAPEPATEPKEPTPNA